MIIVEAQQQKEGEEAEEGKKNPFEAQQRRRQELQAERTMARESAHSKEEAKEAIARIKKKTERLQTRKRVIKKSVLQAELVRRAKSDPLFKSKLDKILSKALASGGPAYSGTLPGDMSGGQVFQQESLNSQAKPKKCKKCKNKGTDCKC